MVFSPSSFTQFGYDPISTSCPSLVAIGQIPYYHFNHKYHDITEEEWSTASRTHYTRGLRRTAMSLNDTTITRITRTNGWPMFHHLICYHSFTSITGFQLNLETSGLLGFSLTLTWLVPIRFLSLNLSLDSKWHDSSKRWIIDWMNCDLCVHQRSNNRPHRCFSMVPNGTEPNVNYFIYYDRWRTVLYSKKQW